MYPKMMNEVIEAIETHFDDQLDIIVDCMLFLMNSTARVEDVHRIEQWFREHDRCECCGRKLEMMVYKEPHLECGPGVYETLYEPYCPVCDKIGEDI